MGTGRRIRPKAFLIALQTLENPFRYFVLIVNIFSRKGCLVFSPGSILVRRTDEIQQESISTTKLIYPAVDSLEAKRPINKTMARRKVLRLAYVKLGTSGRLVGIRTGAGVTATLRV